MDTYRVAVHEAGHALVNFLTGVEIRLVKIEPTEGAVDRDPPDFDGFEFDDDEAKDELRSLFGGMEAERLVLGDDKLGDSDMERIVDLGSRHAPRNEDGVIDAGIFADQAREMLEEHRTVLESLAEYLLQEGTVSGSELTRFLDARIE